MSSACWFVPVSSSFFTSPSALAGRSKAPWACGVAPLSVSIACIPSGKGIAPTSSLFYKKKEEETRCIDPKGKEWKESKESEYVSLSTLSSQFDEVRENGRKSLSSATSFFLSLSLFLRSANKKDHERKRAGKNRGFSFCFSFRRVSSSAPLGSLWWGSFLPLSSSFLFTGKETQHSRRSQLWRPARKYNSPLSPFLSFFSLFFLLLIISSFDHFEFFWG